MNSKICIVSEAIKRPFDEGVKIFVYNFVKELTQHNTVLGITRSSNYDGEIEKFCTKALPKNKLFISLYLWNKIRSFHPDIIYYIPTACATIYSFLRAKILKLYGNTAKTVMITLQPREYTALVKKIIPFFAPDLILAQSTTTREVLDGLGCKTKMIHAGVNLHKFTPVDSIIKDSLRKKYGFPNDKYIVLHVGHINRNRNVQCMEKIQNVDDIQVIVVGSTSYPEDGDLVEELKEKGVIVITRYIENINEVYQCADCYLFPVFSNSACIEIPLSVFEAMACNLPVVTTKFGELPNLVKEQNGFVYADTMDEIIPKIRQVRLIPQPQTRILVERYSWENVIKQILLNSLSK
ncbi:MAG: glycosyltransferase family 4 protein [Candidatus Hodarchaeota archaeon]